jgi:poly-gamma-glutamate capsule biosynthesis protein CapA/YwtB (metallophosphatase superfamily)
MIMLFFLLSLALANPEYQIGVEALQNKDFSRAETHLNNCIRANPQNIECYWELGWAYWMQGKWSDVVVSWKKVQKLDPKHKEVAIYLPQATDQAKLLSLMEQKKNIAPPSFDTREDSSLRLRAVGDMMIGTSFPKGYLPPSGGKNTFTEVAGELIDADITFGNLEGPLCDSGKTNKCKKSKNCYAFRSPTKYNQIFKEAGFDILSTANNHANDFGRSCLLETEKSLDAVGIKHSGRPGDIASTTINGLRIAMIAFHTARSAHYINDHDTAKILVSNLSADHDIVIVSFHGGAEGSKALHLPKGRETFYGENRGSLREFARDVIDSGADLVLGHGPHVLRGMEVYNDRLVVYSMGNFATYGRFSLTGNKGIGVIVEVNMDSKGTFLGGKLISTKLIGKGTPILDPENKAMDLIRKLSSDDFDGTGILVAQDGTIQKP